MTTTQRFLAALTGAALTIASLAITPAAHANPSGTGLVISEVYGAGGNVGASYNADFIELYNPTGSAIALTGLSVHYRSATGGSGGNPYALAGTVPAGAHWLVQMGSAGATGSVLPTPDSVATPAFSMAAAGGQVYLLNGTAPITSTGDLAGNPAVVDMAGLGTSTSFETAAGPAATAAQSANRSATGADTDNNATDFSLATPTPTANGGGGGPTEPTDATIAEIQGTNAAVSPLLAQTVRTRGVVTALYATGGFNGIYVQTPGTGRGSDATPGASDGVFVYGSAVLAVSPAIGDLVEVTAPVTEFAGETELTPAAGGVVVLSDAYDPVTALVAPYPTTEAGREAHEGELLAPTDDFVVTNNYTTNQYGEIGLATGGRQLLQPTDVADAQDSAAIAAVVADNAARGVVLDDGSSTNFLNVANQGIPLPWLTPDNPVRITSTATFHKPMILDYRNSAWKFQPTTPVTGDGSPVVTFGDTRTPNATPRPVGGDLELGTFNVLNYFNTTGEDWVTSGRGTCTYYNDRAGDPVTDNTCSPNGPRGAAQSSGGTDLTDPTADLERQRTKIVEAINTTDADILSLEEVENSVALGEADRDDALASLVDALNADAGSTRWAYVSTPAAEDLPPVAEQDVIRTAFIYNPETVDLVGGSVVLTDEPAFADAREPLAQAFKRAGALPSDAFLVIVNHFKSKGSGADDGTGQGLANPDRVAQAQALAAFADDVATARGTSKVFLTGDFNSYTEEDPIQALELAGYTNLTSSDPVDTTYQFGGMAGSLDHVLASEDALVMVAGVDIWQINAEESVGFEYSRYNNHATLLYQPNQFRASDHNPEIVGLDVPYSTEDSATDLVLDPGTVAVGSGTTTATATVTSAAGQATGSVDFVVNGDVVVTGTLTGGTASAVLGPFGSVGPVTIEARYSGAGPVSASSDSATLTVVKATPVVSATARPEVARVHKTRVSLTVMATSAGVPVTGLVRVRADGRTYLATLGKGGTVTVTLKAFRSTGRQRVDVSYGGDSLNNPAQTATWVRVVR